MWMECISDQAYSTREKLAADIVRILREELAFLLSAGASLVQFDEPVLSEVVFTGAKTQRSFMCGVLSEKGDATSGLAFARDLVNAVVDGYAAERTAVHVCCGNWTRAESACLSGSYAPLVETLGAFRVGTFFLELCTPRAGDYRGSRGVAGRPPERRRRRQPETRPHRSGRRDHGANRACNFSVRIRADIGPPELRICHFRGQPGELCRRGPGKTCQFGESGEKI
jgi:hypothetical protein